ncbi:MAG: tRNA pseudouridine(38-40) synthase TruA [Thermoguttaceae bacterium]|jgi:tRNA pseudouridine38-40 synthase
MRTFKLVLAYDGTAYAGWQTQVGVRTLQATLEGVIEKITGQTVRTLASGRTDAGVHALGQVVGFQAQTDLTPYVLQRAFNAELPRDMAVLSIAETHAGFHAMRDSLRKRYRYLIHDGPVRDVLLRQYCWHFPYGRLNVEAMQRAAKALVGKHDFSSFQTSGSPRRTSVRTVFELSIQRGRAGGADLVTPDVVMPDFITLEIEADGFLYNMVRAIVGTLVEVGRGTRDEHWPEAVLRACDRRCAGGTAPPQGLFLVRVEY